MKTYWERQARKAEWLTVAVAIGLALILYAAASWIIPALTELFAFGGLVVGFVFLEKPIYRRMGIGSVKQGPEEAAEEGAVPPPVSPASKKGLPDWWPKSPEELKTAKPPPYKARDWLIIVLLAIFIGFLVLGAFHQE